jgi:hypothetical protein
MNEDFWEDYLLEKEDEENSYYEKYEEYPQNEINPINKKALDEAIRIAKEFIK